MTTERTWTLVEVDIAVRARSAEAPDAIESYWRNGPLWERHSEFIQRARSWCEQPVIRAVFETMLPPRPTRVGRAFPSLMDWLALSSVLGRDADVLSWFDERVQAGELPVPPMSRLRRAVFTRGRLIDWLAFADPLESVLEELESYDSARMNLEDAPELLEAQLDETDCEIALWRRVAEGERAEQLSAIDAAIEASERSASIRAWSSRPFLEMAQRLTLQTA